MHPQLFRDKTQFNGNFDHLGSTKERMSAL